MAEQQTIDRAQVRLLVRTNLKIDWRGASNPFEALRSTRGRLSPLLVVLGINLIFSILIGVSFLILPSLFDGLVIGGIGALVLVGIQVLIEFSQILISPDDYFVIAPHPVSSKTFYAAKLVHLLIYVTLLAGSVSIAPSIFAVVASKSIFALPVVIVHFWLVSVFATVLMMVLFTLALRSVNRRRMERMMSYLQVGLILILYAGFYILPSKLRDVLSGLDVTRESWMAALPTYWFATPVHLVADGFDWTSALIGLGGFVFLFALARFALSYLSLSYAHSLTGSIDSGNIRVRAVPPSLRRLWNKLTSPETRAVARLTWAQFKFDNAFRLQVLWIVPITIFAIVYGSVRGMAVIDPLAAVRPHNIDTGGGGAMLGLIAVMTPFMAHVAMIQSKTWRAAWVFHALPVNRTNLVLAGKRIVLMIVLGPISLFLAVVYAWLFHSVLHGFMHAVFVAALAGLGLTVLNIAGVRAPFATEKAYGGFSAESFITMLVAWIVMGIPIGVVGEIGYGGYLGWLIFLASVLLVTWVLTKVQNARIRAKVREWEF